MKRLFNTFAVSLAVYVSALSPTVNADLVQFVPDYNQGAFELRDADTLALVDTKPATDMSNGLNPKSLLDRTRNIIYITTNYSAPINLLSSTSNQVVGFIPHSLSVIYDVELSPDHSRLYLSGRMDNAYTVSVIATDTRKEIATILLSGHGHKIAVSPDSQTLAVLQNGMETDPSGGPIRVSNIEFFNTQTAQLIKNIGGSEAKLTGIWQHVDYGRPKDGDDVIMLSHPAGMISINAATREILRINRCTGFVLGYSCRNGFLEHGEVERYFEVVATGHLAISYGREVYSFDSTIDYRNVMYALDGNTVYFVSDNELAIMDLLAKSHQLVELLPASERMVKEIKVGKQYIYVTRGNTLYAVHKSTHEQVVFDGVSAVHEVGVVSTDRRQAIMPLLQLVLDED